MNIKRISFFSIILASLLTIASCGGVDCDDPAFGNELEQLLNEAVDLAFSFDPTNQDQCNELSSLLEDVIDEANDVEECVPADELDEFRSDLGNIQSTLDGLDCG